MNRLLIFSLIWLPMMLACKNQIEPKQLVYTGKFDATKINEVVKEIRETADNWPLELSEKDRQQMATLTEGEDAFVIMLLNSENEPVITLGNAGFGDLLYLTSVNYSGLSQSEWYRLTGEIVCIIESTADTEMLVSLQDSTADPSLVPTRCPVRMSGTR